MGMASIKSALYDLLEGSQRETRLQCSLDIFLVTLILGNVLAVILESVVSLQLRYEMLFQVFEYFSVFVFTLELALRFWVSDLAPDSSNGLLRKRFWTSPYILVDIVAILPFYLGYFFNFDLRLLRLLRLFRIFKITPYFNSLSLLGSVLKQEYRPMVSALAVIVILMLFAAGGIYLLERDVQSEAFGDLPSALWWVVVTLTTVGYGDAVPATGLGRILGAVIMILGVGMVALPAGMLASRFSEVMHRKQEAFRRFVEEHIDAEGDLSEELIEQQRRELFVSRTEANSIVADYLEDAKRRINFCPNCGKKLSNRTQR